MPYLRKSRKKYKGGDAQPNPPDLTPVQPEKCKLTQENSKQRSWVPSFLSQFWGPAPPEDDTPQPSMDTKKGGSRFKTKRYKKGGFGDYVYLNRKRR
jgi:hypothetical protein